MMGNSWAKKSSRQNVFLLVKMFCLCSKCVEKTIENGILKILLKNFVPDIRRSTCLICVKKLKQCNLHHDLTEISTTFNRKHCIFEITRKKVGECKYKKTSSDKKARCTTAKLYLLTYCVLTFYKRVCSQDVIIAF